MMFTFVAPFATPRVGNEPVLFAMPYAPATNLDAVRTGEHVSTVFVYI